MIQPFTASHCRSAARSKARAKPAARFTDRSTAPSRANTGKSSLATALALGLVVLFLLGGTIRAQRIRPQRKPGTGRLPAKQVRPERVDSDRVEAKKPRHAKANNKDRVKLSRKARVGAKLGLPQVRQWLDGPLPTGRGVIIGQVEGQADKYTPRMNQKRYARISFIRHSGESKTSGHANVVASWMYGKRGLAPGVREVHLFSASDFMSDGYLHTGQPLPPQHNRIDIFNHSWIGKLKGKKGAAVLRRVDYVIDAYDVLMCAGVNNGRNTSVPALLCSSHNVIAVGQAHGKSSGGYTQIEVKGRSKPDIVAPGGKTSFSTPVVTAVAARLLEAARSMDEQSGEDTEVDGTSDDAGPPPTEPISDMNVHSQSEAGNTRNRQAPKVENNPQTHSEVIKAVLLAGATKPNSWSPEKGRPLDEHLGAGMVHAGNSLRILTSGEVQPGRVRQRFGWDFAKVKTQTTNTYRFDVRRELGPASIILTWNRRIDGRTVKIRFKNRDKTVKGWVNAPHLANLDLELLRIKDDGSDKELAASTSDIDNVEHIYLPKLKAGRYQLRVIRHNEEPNAPTWDYALAWRLGGAM